MPGDRTDSPSGPPVAALDGRCTERPAGLFLGRVAGEACTLPAALHGKQRSGGRDTRGRCRRRTFSMRMTPFNGGRTEWFWLPRRSRISTASGTRSPQRAPRSESSTGARARTSFAIQTMITGSGWFSTWTRRAIEISCLTPTCRRSLRKADSRVGPRRRSSPGPTTHKSKRQSDRTTPSKPPVSRRVLWTRSSSSALHGKRQSGRSARDAADHDPDEEQEHELVDDPGVLVHPVADLWHDPLRSLAHEQHGERRSAEKQQREAEEPNRVPEGIVRRVQIATDRERGERVAGEEAEQKEAESEGEPWGRSLELSHP